MRARAAGGSRAPVLALIAAALTVCAALFALETRAATNNACDVSHSSGFAVCVVESSPWQAISIHAFHVAGTPYRFGAYNASIGAWQGGPWTRLSVGGQPPVAKHPSWNWFGTVRHQVDNQGTGLARYSTSLD